MTMQERWSTEIRQRAEIRALIPRLVGLRREPPRDEAPHASSLRPPGLRHILVPARDYLSATYSSVLPYRVRDGQILVGAIAEAPAIRATTLDDVDDLVQAVRMTFELLWSELAGPLGRSSGPCI